MSFVALVLLIVAVGQLVRTVVSAKPMQRLGRLSLLCTAVLLVLQIRLDGLLLSMVPVYLLIGITLAAALFRLHSGGPRSRRRSLCVRAGLVVLSLPLVAVPIVEATMIPLEVDDFRDDSWSSAFDRLHATLRAHYGFGEWKQVDWQAMHHRHRAAVRHAEQAGDSGAYYRAVRAYLYEIPDGHVGIDGPDHAEIRQAEIGGGYGFAVQPLDDGTVIATTVNPRGPAAEAGMVWGAEIVAWDGMPAPVAAAVTSTLWASRPPATAEVASISQYRFLTRDPVGTRRSVTFRNPGRTETTTVQLTARDDNYRTLSEVGPSAEPVAPVSQRMLEDNVGYLRIASLETLDGLNPPQAAAEAIRALGQAKAMIVDTRGNRGGLDNLVPPIMSHFTPNRLLYEHIATRTPFGGDFRLVSLHVEPNDLQFSGPVVVLVDHRTKSSGEGFALIAKQLPNVSVMGLSGTNGSFGMAGGSVLLPTGITVVYPWGRSLDGTGTVQVDGDHRLRGGVEPDRVVPLTVETVRAIHRGDDVVLRAAQDWLAGRTSVVD